MALNWAVDGADWPNREYSRFVLAGGVRFHVQVLPSTNKRSRRSVVLIHGTGGASHSWRDLANELARDYTVIIPDLPGHGFSAPAAFGQASLQGMGKALLALFESLNITPTVLVGHSAGAAIAIWIALHGGLPVRHIAAINGAVLPLRGIEGQVFSPLAKLLSMNGLAATLFATLVGDRVRVQRMLLATGSDIDDRGVELYQRLLRDRHHVAGALAMMAQWNLDTLADEITGLRGKLHLIAGSNDRTVPPAQSRHLHARVPGSSLQVLDGLGHLAHEEQPERIAEWLITLATRARANPANPAHPNNKTEDGNKPDRNIDSIVI